MKILTGILADSIFLWVSVPFVLWTALKALATPSPKIASLLYFLAIGYAAYALFVGVYARHIRRFSAVFLGVYIVAGAFLIPLTVLLAFRLTGTEYTVFPAIPPLPFQLEKDDTPTLSIGILLFSYGAMELIFAFLWCPFRKYTVVSCAGARCKMTRACKGCKAVKGMPCMRCKLYVLGFFCLIGLGVLTLFVEPSLGILPASP